MYLSIRRYEGFGGKVEEITQRVQGLIPVLRSQPGFVAYYNFASEQGDAVSIRIFDDRQSAKRADEQTREWTLAHMRDLLPDPPDILAGEVRHQTVGTRASFGQPFVLIRVMDGITAPAEEMAPQVQQHSLTAIKSAPGLQAAYILRDERDQRRAATVTLFDTHEHAMAAHDRAVSIMREKMAVTIPNPPRVVALGQIVIMAFA
jgi:heme-degrading monooxygenase HmoA